MTIEERYTLALELGVADADIDEFLEEVDSDGENAESD